MPRYIVLAREAPEAFADVGPAEIQAIIERYHAWTTALAERGRLEAGHKLADGEGRVVRGPELSATDGPFAEAKEVVGGFWILEAADMEEAQALVADSPHLDYGSLELRRIEELDFDD